MDRSSPIMLPPSGTNLLSVPALKTSTRSASGSSIRVLSPQIPRKPESPPTVPPTTTQGLEVSSPPSNGLQSQPRRLLFGLGFLLSLTNLMRQHPANSDEQITHNDRSSPPIIELPHNFMSNSPTIANLSTYASDLSAMVPPLRLGVEDLNGIPELESGTGSEPEGGESQPPAQQSDGKTPEIDTNGASSNPQIIDEVNPTPAIISQPQHANHHHHHPEPPLEGPSSSNIASIPTPVVSTLPISQEGRQLADTAEQSGMDKDGFFLIRLTPLIDHSLLSLGLYFAPIIRKMKPTSEILIGRYTEKNKLAAHAPQGSLAPVVFKSKVVSRVHALFSCNDDGQWFLKDCKSSSGTFLNHIRLSQALQELLLMPLIDGDIIQLGMDYRGGTEEVYRCVKMRCEFNKSWQRKVNQFNLEIHKKLKNLSISNEKGTHAGVDILKDGSNHLVDELLECAICLLKLEPCQAMFISPCLHLWHYKCIRPVIIKSYPQFYCPNCRSMCDLETDIEDDD